MYTLMLQRSFHARHFLVGGDWGAENHVHAHAYRVEVRLAAPDLDQHGYLVDLEDLEVWLDACVGRYQDKVLNDLPDFQGLNPSIEHFAQRFFACLHEQMTDRRLESMEVRIWENDAAWAAYRKRL
jgi:6-pyruvoyltetrahydropterin/6-carboxytetrahydropterin synthase